MAFFLIVPSVMIVSILLVHALANRLGLRIYYTTFIAAAILSVAVTFAATFAVPAVGRKYLLALGSLILASSFFLTLANKFLHKKEQAEEKNFQEEVKAAYEAEKKKDASIDNVAWNVADNSLDEKNFLLTDVKATVDNSAAEDKIPADKSIKEDDVPTTTPIKEEEIPDNKLADEDKPLADEPIKEDNAPVDNLVEENKTPTDTDKPTEIDTELDDNSSTMDSFPLEKVFKPLHELKHEDADKPVKLVEKPEPHEDFPLEEVFKPLSDVKPEEVKHFDIPAEKKSERTELFPLQEVFKPLSTLNLDKIEEITQEEKALPQETEKVTPEEKIDTLDELLDRAYDERDKGHVWQAIEIYRKALERYQNDEYAPFVAIDLGNIYKEQALYTEAIKIYEQALTLPAVNRNASTKKEFANNLQYLRVIYDVLLKYHVLSTPFSQLSREILQEIDTEFKKVQINSAQ